MGILSTTPVPACTSRVEVLAAAPAPESRGGTPAMSTAPAGVGGARWATERMGGRTYALVGEAVLAGPTALPWGEVPTLRSHCTGVRRSERRRLGGGDVRGASGERKVADGVGLPTAVGRGA